MGSITINLPRLGETMEEARVTTWIVAPNIAFKRGDVLLEVETDKTVVEVPALQDGIMLVHLVGDGDVVALEAPIAVIETANLAQQVATIVEPKAELAVPFTAAAAQVGPHIITTSLGAIAASPAARSIARQLGVSLLDVSGTGRNGRISADDVRGGGSFKPKATVVLLHGLFDNHRGWRDLPQRFMAAGYDVANFDLPGHGDVLPAAQNFDDAVQIITRHIRETLSGKNIIIVGHSLGAALGASVAAELLKQRANFVEGLMLLSPAGLGARINADFIDGMLAASTRSSLKKCLSLLDAGPMSDASFDTELIRLLKQRPIVRALVQSAAQNGFQQIDIASIVSGLKMPVTAVFGLKDEIINWQDCSALSQNTAVHFVAEAGHLPHILSPDFICQLVFKLSASNSNMANAA